MRNIIKRDGTVRPYEPEKIITAMGKAFRVKEDASGCLSGSCKHCPEGNACLREWWALR